MNINDKENILLSLNEKKNIVDSLKNNISVDALSLKAFISDIDNETEEYLFKSAREVCDSIYGKDIYIRGIIEFSNYCKNDCKYCGIRRSNSKLERYRLNKEIILECAQIGYDIGFRTIVLQSGEDLKYSDSDICEIISSIKEKYPEIAVTLSIGEKSREAYQSYFDAGADRYLLRHETINPKHYEYLHPFDMSRDNRIRCLYDLKEIGYQVGCGIMVGSPMQTLENVVDDLIFMKDFNPHMIGIGPFIPHKDTPFAGDMRGDLKETLHLLSIIRLMLPRVLLPATTALASIHPKGREMGILAGANVIMPNISPMAVRDKYTLYDGKIYTKTEASDSIRELDIRMKEIGYYIKHVRGDYING